MIRTLTMGGVLLLAGCYYHPPYQPHYANPYPRPYPYSGGYPASPPPQPYYPPSNGNGYPTTLSPEGYPTLSPEQLQRYGSQPWQNVPTPNLTYPQGGPSQQGYAVPGPDGYTTTPLSPPSDQPTVLAPPSQTYQPPPQTYPPQSNQPTVLAPPSQNYQPPPQTYQPPSQTYQPPAQTYQPPSQTYQPPAQTYQPPAQTYQPTDLSPQQAPSTQGESYQPGP